MATTPATDSPLLDQLQAQVNRVLEQTTRVLATSKHANKSIPIAQVTKLKRILPDATERFNNALDQLEAELQRAKLVMRRDLAVCRESTNIAAAVPSSTSATTSALDPATTATSEVASAPNPDSVPVQESSEDVLMGDAEPEPAATADDPDQENPTVAKESEAVTTADLTSKPEEPASENAAPAEPTASSQALQIDTKAQTKDAGDANDAKVGEDNKQPDTGTLSNANDLESLFGPPVSANVGDAPDFDFGSLTGADNGELATLLPGLQDYANTQPNGSNEPDFEALFSADMPTVDGVGGDVMRDSTFDDLMDFGDFGAGDFTAGNANNGNEEFDFSFD